MEPFCRLVLLAVLSYTELFLPGFFVTSNMLTSEVTLGIFGLSHHRPVRSVFLQQFTFLLLFSAKLLLTQRWRQVQIHMASQLATVVLLLTSSIFKLSTRFLLIGLVQKVTCIHQLQPGKCTMFLPAFVDGVHMVTLWLKYFIVTLRGSARGQRDNIQRSSAIKITIKI